ncbi:hypothetical protein BJX61DRAFT_546605 [Aspergillus egyptiacus]|nr:hypothetical protein BJX61DRAFT_546605 [Aspergillus egyptiacus]
MVSTRGKKRSREGHEEPTDAPTPKRATRQASSRQSTASPSRQTSGVVTRAQSASRSTQFSSSSAKKALPVRTNRVVTRSKSASRSRQSTPQPSSTSSHVVTRARAACGASSPAPQVVLSSATSEPSNVADQHDEAEHEDEDNDEDDDEYENEETDTESPTRSGSDSGANDKTEEQPPKKRKVGNRGPHGPKKGFELRKDSTGAVRAHYDDTLDWIGAQQNGGIPPKIRKRVEVDYYLDVTGAV